MANDIRIKIGASVDSNSVERAFKSIEQRAGQAQVKVRAEAKRTANAVEQEAKKQLKAQQQLAKAAEQLDKQRSAGLYRQFKQQEAAAERAARAQERAQIRAARVAEQAQRRALDRIWKDIERNLRAAERAAERERRARQRAAVRQGETFARRTSHRATRFLAPEVPIGAMAARGLRDFGQGIGVDFSIAGSVARATSLEAQATKISNSGYLPNDVGSPNAKRVDPKELVAQAREVAGQYGLEAGTALDALDAFATRAGDLDTGRQMLADMAKLSAATGTELGHMAQASAAVYQSLGDIPNKSEAVLDVMRTIAGQGKLGAVEIADMATQMARVAAASMSFAGDRGENIKTLGGLAQYARARGGAPSAAEAARSISGFASTLQKSARIKQFDAKGVDIFADKNRTKLRDPVEIIIDSLKATGGNLQEMNKLFMDVVGARTVKGLSDDFLQAGGGEKGAQAVREVMSRMKAAAPSDKEVEESARRASETAAAKAARFQNQLDTIAEKTMTQLIPALEKAGPSLLKFAEVVGRVSTWAVENPKMAIAGAISASIARAGIESALRAGIERVILGAENSRAATVGKLASTVGGAATIATLGISVLTVASLYAESLVAEKREQFDKGMDAGVKADDLEIEAHKAIERGDLAAAEQLAKKALHFRQLEAQGIANSADANQTGLDYAAALVQRKLVEAFIPGGADAIEAEDKAIKMLMDNNAKKQDMLADVLRQIRDKLPEGQPIGGAPPGGRASQ